MKSIVSIKAIFRALPLVALLSWPLASLAQRTDGGIIRVHKDKPITPSIVIFPPIIDTLSASLSVRSALQTAIITTQDTLRGDSKTPVTLEYKLTVLEDFLKQCRVITDVEKFQETGLGQRIFQKIVEFESTAYSTEGKEQPLVANGLKRDEYYRALRNFFLSMVAINSQTAAKH